MPSRGVNHFFRMTRDLTTSEIYRQNILNNHYALQEVQTAIGLQGVVFEGEIKFTRQQLASFFWSDGKNNRKLFEEKRIRTPEEWLRSPER